MRVLIALTYFRPHYSGLTIYAERLAGALAQRDHQVTVLTSRYDRDLPLKEVRDEVEILRVPVMMRISKGVLMPMMPFRAWQQVRRADVVNLHVPQLDAAPIALLSRILHKPVVLTYHCDLQLPSGLIHYIANQVSHLANHISAGAAQAITTNTRDYAENSRFLRRYLPKINVLPPPVVVPEVAPGDLEAFRLKAGFQEGQRVIGMAARLATEKGVEFLVQALPKVLEKHSGARVLFVGQHKNVLGEDKYAAHLAPLIQALGNHWTFLGSLSPVDLAAFYHLAEVLVLPSINSTESFGMVQVEAMVCGTPVVASDIPGVRQAVVMTGMGKIVPARDAEALANAIVEVLDNPARFRGDVQAIRRKFDPHTIAETYEQIYKRIMGTSAPIKEKLADDEGANISIVGK